MGGHEFLWLLCLSVGLSVCLFVSLFVHLENGVCSLGWRPAAGGRLLLSGHCLCTYQQLDRIRPAGAAGAIAVAYFAFRWLIRTRSLEGSVYRETLVSKVYGPLRHRGGRESEREQDGCGAKMTET